MIQLSSRKRNRQRGFTLMELLVTLAIMGVLTALALPGYASIMQHAQRNEARLALLGIQYAQEVRYLKLQGYSEQLTEAVATGGLGLAERTSSRSYQLSVELRNAGQGYLATARTVPGSRQSGDGNCARLTIDETGRRAAVATDGRDTSAMCWG